VRIELRTPMSFFRNASIRAKLSVLLGLATALVVAVGLVGLMQLQSVNRVATEIRTIWLPQVERLDELKRAAAEHRMLATRRIQTTNFRHLADIAKSTEATLAEFRKAEQAVRTMIDSTTEQVLFTDFRQLWDDYQSSYATVLQRLEVGDIRAATVDFNNASLVAFDSAASNLDLLIAYAKQQSAQAGARADEVYRFAIFVTALAAGFAVLLSGLALVWTSHNVTSPIRRVSDAMRRLTAGDHSVALMAERERKDEIGVLVEAASRYRNSLLRTSALAAEAEAQRERLQAAVSNMPIGLSMFDRSQRLIVSNECYAEIYQLPPELVREGTPLRDIIHENASRNLSGVALNQHVQGVLDSVRSQRPTRFLVKLDNGRTINVIRRPMAGGGVVATHEDITERIRAEAQIHHMARHDALTDLPNRLLFKDRVDEAIKQLPRGGQVAVLSLDLDRFKSVNDTLGHPVGDSLLKLVADRLGSTLRESDLVARFGGDEFAIVQVGGIQPQDSTVLAQRIIDVVSAPCDIDGHHVVIGASIGIAVVPMDGLDAEQLLKNSDMALYRAKNDGRGTFRFFEPEMDALMQARRNLELDLRQAILEGQFELYYQPVVNVQTNEISGFEALLRWNHPKRGMVSPGEFVPLAEEIGLIVPIGEWVLRQACRDAAAWAGDAKVAVNISPAQFKSKKLLESVVMALSASRLPPHRLELEITEGVLLVEHESTVSVLHQLSSLGVRIAMDDFGTGYSSLSYLRSFPFDKIKIDGSFVRSVSKDDSSLAIIRAVTGLSTSLGMVTTAEGVETPEQLDRIRLEGCTEVQGYLISRPQPASEIPAILRGFQQRAAAA
jgi:diguanylate cyclase (GGDEF)-like protein